MAWSFIVVKKIFWLRLIPYINFTTTNMNLDSVTQNTSDNTCICWTTPVSEISMEFRGFHCHFHGVFGLHFHGLPKNSRNLVENWVASIFYAFYKFPWIPQIISVESMEQSDSISMESTQCFILMFMQPWMPWKAMEEVEFHGSHGTWSGCWNLHFKYIFITNVVKKLLVELKYKTKDLITNEVF